MKRNSSLVARVVSILFVITTAAGCASLSDQAVEMVDHPAPLTRITMLDGEYKTMEEFVGKDVFILFWATWCSHSRSAIEDFDRLAQRYGVNSNYVFLAISVDKAEDLAILKDRIASEDLTHIRHAFSGNDSQDEAFVGYYGTIIPYVVALDRNQIVRLVDKSVSALESYVEDLRK